MGDFDWKKTLAKVAPGIATALGGPMAGVAVSMATKALGIDGGDEGDLAAAVASGDPNVLVKLKEVENDFKLEMKRLDVQLHESDTTDRSSARTMAAAVGMAPQVILSTIYTTGYFWLLYEILVGELSVVESMEAIVNTLLGVMTAAQIQIMNFWFGSSAGSKHKTDVMSGK